MTVSAENSGTQTATVTTEHTLESTNVAGVFVLEVDLVNMAAADVLELRVYAMVLTSGTERVVFFGQWAGAQPVDDLIAVSLPISNELTDATALKFTLKQTFGTGRSYPWKVLKHA